MKKGALYYILLIALFLIFWIWAAINPLYQKDWLMENYLVFIFIPLILIAGYYFRLSKLSYTLITFFMILHVIGSHYTYAEVPFGFTLQNWLNSNRNMYDRLVHFSFGLLLAYPIREIFVRLTKAKGFWGYYLPLDLTLAFSAIYEIIEWITAVNVDASAGLAFLGAQGDIWDAQKDMLIAGIGAAVTMSITFFINLVYNKNCWKEIKESFHIQKNDAPLGEVKLEKLIRLSK
ncbi:MAG: DUF2238 domain-containing protein [Nanoarchaeota archaeon]